MILLFISGIFLAGLVGSQKFSEPSGDKWPDYKEYQAFQREREKWLFMMSLESNFFNR